MRRRRGRRTPRARPGARSSARRSGPAGIGGDDPAGDGAGGARRPVGLAAPVPLDDRRLERAGGRVPAGGGLREAQEQRGAEREVRGDDRGGAGRRRRSRTRAVSPSQPVVARTNAPVPGLQRVLEVRRRPRRRATRRRRRRRSERGRRTPSTGRPTTAGAGQPAAVARGRRSRAEAARSVDEEVHDSDVLSRYEPRFRRSENQQRPRHHRGVRGPSAPPVPEAPWFVARAPSEPQGPSLPAGPPRLLLGVGGRRDTSSTLLAQCAAPMDGLQAEHAMTA